MQSSHTICSSLQADESFASLDGDDDDSSLVLYRDPSRASAQSRGSVQSGNAQHTMPRIIHMMPRIISLMATPQLFAAAGLLRKMLPWQHTGSTLFAAQQTEQYTTRAGHEWRKQYRFSVCVPQEPMSRETRSSPH
jgi:hypothetical protein